MFESIRDALVSSDNNNGGGAADILKTEVGNTYTVRLVPYMKDPKKTFFHYFQHGWNSLATGQYVSAISPQTWGERDPIAETRYKLYRGSDEEKALAGKIVRAEKWLVNVYVVNDPVTPDNNGKVMILRYGKQLQKIIANAIDGEDASDLGPRIFDFTPNGVNLKIVVEKQGDYPTYVSSKFTFPTEVKGVDEDTHQEILDKAFDLENVFNVKSYNELKEMVDEHIYCVTESEKTDKPVITETKKAVTVEKPVAVDSNQTDIDAINQLLDGLDL